MQIKWIFACLICLMFMCLNLWYFYSTNRFHCNKCKKQSDYFHISNQQNLPCLVYQESQWNIQLCCIHWTNALVSLGWPPGVHCSGATHTFYYRKVSSHSTLVCRIDVNACVLILRKNSPLHGIIWVCTFIDFEKKFPPARLFWPARLMFFENFPRKVPSSRTVLGLSKPE